jgi:hypothetical protein
MLALSAVTRCYSGFLLVIRTSCFLKSFTFFRKDSPVRVVSLKSFFGSLDNKDYESLAGRRRSPTTDSERR